MTKEGDIAGITGIAFNYIQGVRLKLEPSALNYELQLLLNGQARSTQGHTTLRSSSVVSELLTMSLSQDLVTFCVSNSAAHPNPLRQKDPLSKHAQIRRCGFFEGCP